MATSVVELIMSSLPELRYLGVVKRVRAQLAGQTVADSTAAVLVWEPMRVVPQYAVPESDLSVRSEPVPPGPEPEYRAVGFGDGPPLLDPSVPFAVHTAPGEPVVLPLGDATGAGFRLADADLAGYVALDFEDFDWLEEDQPLVGHPRDPMHRIDVCPSSRTIRIEHDGAVLAETSRAKLLFEGTFPIARYYLPLDDVRVPLHRSDTQTTCAYKGHATHWHAELPDGTLTDIAWSYENPEHDAQPVAGLVCFYNERLDMIIDGVATPRLRTPWSPEPSPS